jgi:hypothetical protein
LAVNKKGRLQIFTPDRQASQLAGWKLVSLIPPKSPSARSPAPAEAARNGG